MRHAKAEQVGRSDLERPLAERGLADAAAAGRWLAGQGFAPDQVLVSAATRTRQTWAAVAAGAGWAPPASFDEGLYAAGPETALDLIRAVPEQTGTLLVIGHNPTVAQLAQMLDDGGGDAGAMQQMTLGFPTNALAVLRHDDEWASLDVATARLTAFHVARA